MGRPTNSDMIKRLLTAWGLHRAGDIISIPDDVKRVDEEISRLSPQSVRILKLQYCDPRPQKAKAGTLHISRQMFSARLRWIHEQLAFTMERNNKEDL
jgi:hypothetical protein